MHLQRIEFTIIFTNFFSRIFFHEFISQFFFTNIFYFFSEKVGPRIQPAVCPRVRPEPRAAGRVHRHVLRPQQPLRVRQVQREHQLAPRFRQEQKSLRVQGHQDRPHRDQGTPEPDRRPQEEQEAADQDHSGKNLLKEKRGILFCVDLIQIVCYG